MCHECRTVERQLSCAVLWHQFEALLVNVVVTVLALQALFEETLEQLLAAVAHSGPSVAVHHERMRDLDQDRGT